ncbi:MAG: 23S rRNA (pseudouridine(1915)-N(3))-methyltransferase RlmH [Rhizobiaceae bacterium]|nr:23S rRNA (pseudouridine(1915)-N(3))-methyltransferase RlmH [Rhizobiaceae bacterium]
MRISVHAVGKMKAGPEQELADRFFGRFGKAAPAIGLGFGGVREIAEGRAGPAAGRTADEASRLAERLPPDAELVLLDERGRDLSSADFAAHVARSRDGSRRDMAIVIGGPDGHDPAFRARAGLVMSFGRATWPHQLVRVMLAEQLYRAATILAGHPYHRV